MWARVLILLPVFVLLIMGFQRRWVAEDAFITFRVVNNLLEGHGPVFNVGERVEAYTHPLWFALLTVWTAVGGRVEIGAVIMGIFFSCVGLLTAQRGAGILARRHTKSNEGTESSAIFFPFGSMIFVAVPVVWDYVTSGLETGLMFAWLGTSFWLLVRCCNQNILSPERRNRPGMWRFHFTGMLVGLGPLIRPDLAIFSVMMLVVLLVSLRSRGAAKKNNAQTGQMFLFIAVSGALPIAYQVFRMGYFAALVPNTALAKEAGMPNWRQGWLYLRDFVETYWLWIPLAFVGFAMVQLYMRLRQTQDRPAIWVIAAVLFAAVQFAAFLHALWVVQVGGDFMHGRFWLPAFFGGLLPVMIIQLDTARWTRWRLLLPILVFAWCVICAGWLRTPYRRIGNWQRIVDERSFYSHHSARKNPVTFEDYRNFHWHEDGVILRRHADEYVRDFPTSRKLLIAFTSKQGDAGRMATLSPQINEHIALAAHLYAVGMAGFGAGSRVWIIDHLGLADPLVARFKLATRSRPGHEKMLPEEWLLARFADEQEVVSPEVDAARQALGCGDLKELLSAIQEPMNLRRFVQNFLLAPRLHHLRIDSDPVAARHELCGY